MTVEGERVQLDMVPQGACPVCGSRVYKAGVIEAVEAMMRGRPTQGSGTADAPSAGL
jgi:hypothetical protein